MLDRKIFFNGIDGGTGEYRWPPLTPAEFAARVRGDAPAPVPRAPLAFLEASDLRQVGWGVVFSEAPDPGVREALAPLLARRKCQAGNLYRELTYSGGSWLQFLGDYGASPTGVVDPRLVPYYLLLVGDPRQIPFELQYLLDVSYAVGRLSFDTADEYARYVEGVLAAERRQVVRPRRVDLFGVRNGDDPNTAACERYLVDPLAAALAGQAGFAVRSFRRQDAAKARLERLLGGDDTSALLLTAGHAICFWPQDPLQRTDQGGLLCDDWPGPGHWQGRVPREHYFAAHDVADAADVRGLIAFHFACFSAGTPRLDAFSRAAGAAIPQNAPEDFLAALPRRLLGHPRGGALAVIGHVDQAWPHSFAWGEMESPQIAHFESAFRQLLAGQPVGWALEPFGQRYAQLAAGLTQGQENRREAGEPPLPEDERQALLWQAHNDARSYVLLGDPAVRLPLAPGEGEA